MSLLTRFQKFYYNHKYLKIAYPENSSEYYKIAIFGSSAAAGYSSERGFGSILNYYLNKPGKKFYIKNYAECGVPFSGYQAEIAKEVMHKYDTIIIFAGNNETLPWLYNICFYEQYDPYPRMLEDALNQARLSIKVKKRSSLLIAVIKKIFEKIFIFCKEVLNKIMEQKQIFSSYMPFGSYACIKKEIEDFSIVGQVGWEKIDNDFKQSISNVVEKARKYNIKIIICSLPTDETYPPFFSFFQETVTHKSRSLFKELYQKGLWLLHQEFVEEALVFFLRAKEIDATVAILNYQLARVYQKLEKNESKSYFRRAINYCGYRSRYPDVFRQISKEIAEKNAEVTFIDMIDLFHKAMENGKTNHEDLFSDLQHPSLLGHGLIASSIMKCLLDMGVRDVYFEDSVVMLEQYKRELDIKQYETLSNYLLNVRWHLGLTSYVTCEDFYIKKASLYLEKWMLGLGLNKTTDQKITYYFFLSLIQLKKNKLDEATYFLNKAVEEDKEVLFQRLNGVDSIGRTHLSLLKSSIGYDETKNRFYFLTDSESYSQQEDFVC